MSAINANMTRTTPLDVVTMKSFNHRHYPTRG
jgi:hypothetical protein